MSKPPASKRRRVELSLEDKISLIRESESKPKPTLKVLSEKYGIGKTTVGDILKQKDQYKGLWEKKATPDRRRFGNDSKFERLNCLVWDWFCAARSKKLPVTGPLVQEKALQFSEELGLTEFKASNGWLEKWKSRYNLKSFKVSGESAGVDMNEVDGFKSRISEFVEGYEMKNVFNCDETGLYYRSIPDKTLAVKGSDVKGTKVSKDRITVMFACSASGEKLRPLVIGKAKNPHVNKSELKVKYTSNKKAWINNKLFMEWINELNAKMRGQGRKILLMLDNATSHGKEEDFALSHVKVKFLPANTTSHLQPLDQGIIATFKSYYRKLMLQSLLSKMDKADSAPKLCKQISLLDAITWTVKAWDTVKPETIAKCFAGVGFCDSEYTDSDTEYEDDDIPLIELVRQLQCTPEDFQEMEDGIPTEDNTEEWERNLVESYKEPETVCDPVVIECESVPDPEPVCDLRHGDVLGMLEQLKSFAMNIDSDYLESIQELICMTESKIVKTKCQKQKQGTLDYFIKK